MDTNTTDSPKTQGNPSVGSGALFGGLDASSASVAAYAVTVRGAAQPAEKLSITMTTNPDGKPYIHNAEQSEAAKSSSRFRWKSAALAGSSLSAPSIASPATAASSTMVDTSTHESIPHHRKPRHQSP